LLLNLRIRFRDKFTKVRPAAGHNNPLAKSIQKKGGELELPAGSIDEKDYGQTDLKKLN
jgi:hypothetical protein